MADYDYKAGKQRLEEILDNDMEVASAGVRPHKEIINISKEFINKTKER